MVDYTYYIETTETEVQITSSDWGDVGPGAGGKIVFEDRSESAVIWASTIYAKIGA